MADWILGDVHGCWRTLKKLLGRMDFDPARDRIIQVGDLVNRGTGSLEVARWARDLGERFRMVLGNHEIYLLARAAGAPRRSGDTLRPLLKAPDGDQLVDWFRSQPLVIRHGDTVVVHAGLMPAWSLRECLKLAKKCAKPIRQGGILGAFARRKLSWNPEMTGKRRRAAAITVFTRVRMVRADGRPELSFSDHPDRAPKKLRPWYEGAAVTAEGLTVVFGHWAMLGLYRGQGVVCLDSGCVYGGSLSALCLDTGDVAQVPRSKKDAV